MRLKVMDSQRIMRIQHTMLTSKAIKATIDATSRARHNWHFYPTYTFKILVFLFSGIINDAERARLQNNHKICEDLNLLSLISDIFYRVLCYIIMYLASKSTFVC
jgi:hypothetical protein